MLAINELFETIQGEGVYTGVAAIFLRLQGCPVGCPWCDTQQTWDLREQDRVSAEQMILKTGDSPSWTQMTEADVLALIQRQGYTARHVVITGGEPCMFDLLPLTTLLHEHGYQTQIETSGTFAIACHPDTWVTVSPKLDMPGGLEVRGDAMARANEVKHPIAMQKHINALDALLERHPVTSGTTICLQPISQRPRATELAIKTCRERNWRLSVQLHKYLSIE